jgi:hypothetical protein
MIDAVNHPHPALADQFFDFIGKGRGARHGSREFLQLKLSTRVRLRLFQKSRGFSLRSEKRFIPAMGSRADSRESARAGGCSKRMELSGGVGFVLFGWRVISR